MQSIAIAWHYPEYVIKGADNMAQTAQINFRIDEDVKKNAESVLNDLGLSMSAAITVFLKKVVRERRIPFDLSLDPFYSESNMNYLKNIVEDVRTGNAKFSEHELAEDE